MENAGAPEFIWMVATELGGNIRYWYAGTTSHEHALNMAARMAVGEPVHDAKLIKNIENVRAGEWRECPVGPTREKLV